MNDARTVLRRLADVIRTENGANERSAFTRVIRVIRVTRVIRVR